MKSTVDPSADPGARPELRWIDKRLIDVDRRYQRDITVRGERHVNNILREFEWKFFQVVTVTPSKGRYNAIDGQHRLAAAMRHPKVKDVPCVVIPQATLTEQAKVFDIMNTKRLGVSPLAKFHAALAAGDPAAMRVDYICAEAGLTILKSQPQTALPPCSVASTKSISKFKMSDEFMISVLSAATEAWPERANGFRSSNVMAIIKAARKIGTKYDKKKMVEMLKKWDEQLELLKAHAERAEHGGFVAEILAERMQRKYLEMFP